MNSNAPAAFTLTAAAFVSPWNAVAFMGLQPVDVLLTITLVLLIFTELRQGRLPKTPSWVWVGAVGVIAVMAAHLLAPPSVHYLATRLVVLGGPTATKGSTSAGLQWLVALFLLPFMTICVARNNPTVIRRVAVAWLFGASVSGLVAFTDLEHFTSISVQLGTIADSGGRQAGLTSQANNVGVTAAMVTPIAYYFAAKHRVLGGALVVVLAAGALASGSRGGQAGLVAALIVTPILVRQSLRQAPRVIVASAITLGTALYVRPDLFNHISNLIRFTPESGAQSDAVRSLLRQQAWLDFHHSFLTGIGLNAITSAHSIYIQVLAAGGLVLAICLAYYFFGALRTAWQERRTSSIGGYLGVSVAIWLAVGYVENNLTDRYLYMPIACLAAISVLRSEDEVDLVDRPTYAAQEPIPATAS